MPGLNDARKAGADASFSGLVTISKCMTNISGLGNLGSLDTGAAVKHTPKLNINFIDLLAGFDTAFDVTDTSTDDSSDTNSLFGGYESSSGSDPAADLSSWLNTLEENPAPQSMPPTTPQA
jgi:hypothetical protein